MRPGGRLAIRHLALARAVSVTGSNAAAIALSYEVFRRTGSPLWPSASLFFTLGVTGLLAPLAGILVERTSRKALLIASDAAGASCWLALAFVHRPLVLIGLGFLASVAELPFVPASGAAVPNLVDDEQDLARANARLAVASNVGHLLGPSLGGLLVTTGGARLVFLPNAFSFLASAQRASPCRPPRPDPRAADRNGLLAGRERQPAQEPRTQAQASTSTSVPATTVIAGQQVSLKEVESIEGAVRKYFDAFFSADFRGLATHSTGELKVLAGWQRILNGESTGLGALKPAAATVEGLKVVSVTGDAATVEIKGQLDETASVIEGNRGEDRLLSTSIDGAVRLGRGTTWQVADFHRGGRWARGQIYTKVRGQQSGQGVVVKVVGVDLRPKGTVVMMELRNTTGLEAGAGGTVVRDASGKRLQIALGRDLVVVQVKGRSKATTGLFYMSALRPTTRSFSFLVDVNLGCNPVCKVGTSMDIPVRLLG